MAIRMVFSVFIILTAIAGCKPWQSEVSHSTPVKPGPQIFVLFLKADLADGNQTLVHLVGSQTAPGDLKKPGRTSFICPTRIEIRDSSNRILESGFIEHPLIERLEFSDDNQEINLRVLRRESADFVIRTTYYAQAGYFRIISENPDYPTINSNIQLVK
ncbi:MAG: hypothetical protein A2X22_08870 [Bacteroidetes bacterium GWF2_49_14]|nr:MAG: hypothetical protein A2X22_08870 [Bacteroidetes bacterium GWF2_49_14]